MAATKGRAPNRRDIEARDAVLHAADDLLVERGFNGVTVEGIAQRAGVAKQTIYRWWSSKTEILLDTLVLDAEKAPPRVGRGTARAAVRAYLRALARFLATDDAGKVLLALMGAAQHDAEVAAAFHDRFLDPRRVAERALLEAGIDAGEFPADLDVDATWDMLTGPIYFRALTGARLPPSFVDRLLDATLPA